MPTKDSTNVFITTFMSVLLLACETKTTQPSATVHIDSLDTKEKPSVPASIQIRIVPTINSMFSDNNTVHCANVEYLWNALMSDSDKDISGNALAKEFSQSKMWKNSMDTSKLILAFGKPKDVYESVIRQYITKYKINKPELSPQGSTFWGYTHKSVNYQYAEPFEERRLRFLGTEVSAFGFSSGPESTFIKDHFKDQFDILYFDGDGEFVVRLKPANTTDEIILTMINKRGTFREMFNQSRQLIKKGSDGLKRNALVYNLNAEDELIIPVISYNASRNYTELKGLEFSSKYDAIDLFEQRINFKLDRTGVILEANVVTADSIGMPQKPKLLHFDKPFYLYIKEANGSQPYFNLWVSDPEILETKKGTS